MSPDDVVRHMVERLMTSAAESFDLAVARFDANERQAALAHARELLQSSDPSERALGRRLEDEVLHSGNHTPGQLIDAREGQGGTLGPLSLPSSRPSLEEGTSSSDALRNHTTHSSSSISSESPPKRPRGRPRKHPLP